MFRRRRRLLVLGGKTVFAEEIQLTDVKPVIDFTRELMAAHLE